MTDKEKKKYYRDFRGELRFLADELENLADEIQGNCDKMELYDVKQAIAKVRAAAEKLEQAETNTRPEYRCATCYYAFKTCPAGANRKDCPKWEPA